MKWLLSFCLAIALVSCEKYCHVSDCIDSKVDDFITSVQYENASVKEYSFQGKLVYVFDSGSAIVDGAAEVYDADCNLLGYLGGLIGNNKINGVEFHSTAKYKKTLWHN